MPSVPPVGDGDGRTLFVKPLSNVVPFRCSVQPKVHCANLLRGETLVQYSDNMLSCQISAARRKPLGTSVCKGQHLRSPVLIPVAEDAQTTSATAATLRRGSGALATRFAPKRVDIMSVLGWCLGVFRGSTGSRRGLTREVQGAGQVRAMISGAYYRSDPRCESIVGSACNKPPSVARRAGSACLSWIVTSGCLSWAPVSTRVRSSASLVVSPAKPKVHCANLLRRETLVQYSDNMLSCQISAAEDTQTTSATAATLRRGSGALATRFAPKRVDIIRRPCGSAASVLGWCLGVFRGSTGSRRGLTREVQGAGQVRAMISGAYYRSDPRCESIVGSACNEPPSVACTRRAGLIVEDAFGFLSLRNVDALIFFASFGFREFEAFFCPMRSFRGDFWMG